MRTRESGSAAAGWMTVTGPGWGNGLCGAWERAAKWRSATHVARQHEQMEAQTAGKAFLYILRGVEVGDEILLQGLDVDHLCQCFAEVLPQVDARLRAR